MVVDTDWYEPYTESEADIAAQERKLQFTVSLLICSVTCLKLKHLLVECLRVSLVIIPIIAFDL